MKIEKINENQIKFLLTNEDLREREIQLSELAQGSEKAQAFFRDIMREAMIDCGFDASNTPLMIEAMPVTMDTVMIIVSKVNKDVDIENSLSLTPKTLEERKYKQGSIKEITISNVNEVTSDEEEDLSLYSFKTLDDVISVSSRLSECSGKSILYKFQDRYFLLMEKNISSNIDIDAITSEYGEKHISNVISKYYLLEHAELIIKENAIKILKDM